MGLLDGKRLLVTGVITDASLAFHAAPPLVCTLVATTWVSPVDTRTFFKLFAAKNPIHWLSGDQNGVFAPSVPGIACSSSSGHTAEVTSTLRTSAHRIPGM